MTMIEDRPTIAASGSTAAARKAMIDSQLRTSGVNEPWLLAAMNRLPREDYVPEAMRSSAYIDRAVPLGAGRYLAAPLVHGRMLAEAAPTLTDIALLVTSGSGYLEALLRPLVGSLDTVDAADARKVGAGGYTLLVIDGAIEMLPPALGARLTEGGRLVCGLVRNGITRLAAGRNVGGTTALITLAELGIPILPEFAAPAHWSF